MQRNPAPSSCRFSSSQSESASPGKANLRRRSDIKYARRRIASSNGSDNPFAFGAMEIFAPAAVGCFRLVALPRGRDALLGFTFKDDPSASAGASFFFWVILFFFGTD